MNLIGMMIPASGPWTPLWTLWAAGALYQNEFQSHF